MAAMPKRVIRVRGSEVSRRQVIALLLEELSQELDRVALLDDVIGDGRKFAEAQDLAATAREAVTKLADSLTGRGTKKQREEARSVLVNGRWDSVPTGQVMDAYASTDCPECGTFVPLHGRGSRGETVRLVGHCRNDHRVYFDHQVR